MITLKEIQENKVLALSWKEPYGSLMLHGKIETRRWKTNYRGLVLICCSKVPYNFGQVQGISGVRQYERLMAALHNDNDTHKRYGKAIAVARLSNCYSMKPDDDNSCFVEYYPDLFCHVYTDVTPIEPFLWKGKQGWTTVSDEVKSKIILLTQ